MKLGDVMWILVDIDARGEKWRLAVCRQGDFDGDGDMVYFPMEDFEDYAENYEECSIVMIEKPGAR